MHRNRVEEALLGAVGWGIWGDVGQGYKLPAGRWLSSRDLIHSTLNRVNNTACYVSVKKVYLKCSHHK